MLEIVKMLLCSTVEMHLQLQYLNIFAESNYLKKGNCVPCATSLAKRSYSKKYGNLLIQSYFLAIWKFVSQEEKKSASI